MSKTAMTGIHRDSHRSLVEYINATNNINLALDDVYFGKPQAIAGTWREDTVDKNTIVRIVATENSAYRESTLIVYDRLDIGNLGKLLNFKISAYVPETVHDLILPIWRRYGIILSPEEFEDVSLLSVCLNPTEATVYNRKPVSGPLSGLITDTNLSAFDSGTVNDPNHDPGYAPVLPFVNALYRLQPKADALGWIGQVTIEVGEGDAVIGDYLTQEQLPGLNYPVEGDGSNGSAIVYMYGLDFTPVKDVLETYPEDYVVDEFSEDLLDAIKQIDDATGSTLWNLDPLSTEWSLHGAEIVYNGINDATLPTNNRFKYVIGIKLRDDVTTPPGVMYLHYNDPFDPNEI